MKRSRVVAVAACLGAVALLAGCSGGGGAATSSAPVTSGAAQGTASGTPEPEATVETTYNPDAKVVLTMWAWDPGMADVVNVWNQENPDIQVKLSNPAGGDELMAKARTAHAAGNGPDILKAEYQAVPSLIADGVVIDINDYITDIKDAYADNVWALTQFDGGTYGLAQDFAPLMFYYRADLFEQLGISVPTTWDEYKQAAETVRQKDPSKYMGTFSAADPGWFAGLAQQAGADWWSASGTTWNVAINDAPTTKVASFWQDLIDAGSIKGDPFWTPQWNAEMNDGTLISWISGAWSAAQIPGISPDNTGKWKIAALPVWDKEQTGIWGGSAITVTADSKHPAEAAKFITWLNTSKEGMELQIQKIGVYPAATEGRTLPDLDTPPEYFSNQPDYYQVISASADVARSFSLWGPDANVTFNKYSDGFSQAIENKTSFSAVLDDMQSATVADMKKLGFGVAES